MPAPDSVYSDKTIRALRPEYGAGPKPTTGPGSQSDTLVSPDEGCRSGIDDRRLGRMREGWFRAQEGRAQGWLIDLDAGENPECVDALMKEELVA